MHGKIKSTCVERICLDMHLSFLHLWIFFCPLPGQPGAALWSKVLTKARLPKFLIQNILVKNFYHLTLIMPKIVDKEKWVFSKIICQLTRPKSKLNQYTFPMACSASFSKWWNLQIIKNTPEPKRGGIRGTKWKDPPPRRPKNHLRGWTTRRTSSSWTLSCHKKDIQ